MSLMQQDFARNKGRNFDYDKVRRDAAGIQMDAAICRALGCQPRTQEEVWLPEDGWIADMLLALANAAKEATAAAKKQREQAFGGGRTDYDPANPFSRSGSTSRGAVNNKAAAARRLMSHRASPTARAGGTASNAFDSKMFGAAPQIGVPAA